MICSKQYAQNYSKMEVTLDPKSKVLYINQQLTFFNQTNDTLRIIVLNDWNNAYSTKNTPLAKRFSDEFYRGFHLAKEQERVGTADLLIRSSEQTIDYERSEKNPVISFYNYKNHFSFTKNNNQPTL
jgi:hypothetical protein